MSDTASNGATDDAQADAAVLESLRLADSSLPVGTDSVSYGLEAFVAADRVADADDLAALLETYLRRQLGPGDLVALRAAHAAARDASDGRDEAALTRVCQADRRLNATTLPAEFRESATRTGGRLLSLQRELRADPFVEAYARAVEDGETPGAYPVVLGVVTARTGVGERRACLVACQEFVTALAGAAQRLLQLGHTDVQRVVTECQPAMAAAVADSADRSLDEMTPFAPLVEMRSAAHERADRRLFLS
ncbi:MAG: urease accessory protein UreF [Halobacteriales archaeon SW_9_67_25]|nr:MAG: urease accessory protein UreF [Halobacteriales archaeon SW_9_67_25]